MMLRLMTLTEPVEIAETSDALAQKILRAFRQRQEQSRQKILETSFGGSFVLFVMAGLLFAVWQVYCAAFPADHASLESLAISIAGFFGRFSDAGSGRTLSLAAPRFFEWGQTFLLFLAFCMMGFVLRSYAAERGLTRPALIMLCSYAVAGFIVCAGLGGDKDFTVDKAALVGNGAGSLSYLLSTLPAGRSLTLFDILLLENGVVGLGFLTFLLFVPLGYIALSAQQKRIDALIVICGVLIGVVMMLAAFLPFTPPLGGFLLMCAMGLFLAWGASEAASQNIRT